MLVWVRGALAQLGGLCLLHWPLTLPWLPNHPRVNSVQVKRFEEQYKAQHGVLPKGKARAPAKELYNRYRHLKQVVRDGSALHIQTVYRGFRVRNARRSAAAGDKGATPTPTPVRRRGSGSSEVSVIDRDAFGDSGGAGTAGAGSAAESVPSLKAAKSKLKKQLKQFDVDFKAKHGRLVRASRVLPLAPTTTLDHSHPCCVCAAIE